MSYRIALVLALGAATFAGFAQADVQPRAAQTLKVSYADLDLSHPAGVDQLYVRLRQAASLVCNPADTQGLRAQVSYRACAERALDDAVATVNDPNLTALHARGRSS